ncbi:NAD(P)H-dependent oxidoreductase [Massilia sp. DWR3-1-1]|uniref:NAD(P)H-dependent oxidoreductase n=1 Tax=Massilia sp. DWR3-1-1 TaxID=2804559 RepID=UPI003CF3D51C
MPQSTAASSSDAIVPAGLEAGAALRSVPTVPACRVLVLYVHPHPRVSRVNRKLAEAARLVDGVGVDDLYETYPDFFIDVARERALVSAADTLVLVFPTQWYAAPALLKEWFDVVLHDAWQVERVRPTASGAGRRCWLVTSTGGAHGDYAAGGRHGRPLDQFLAPIEQTARVCGMEWLAPLVLYDAHGVDNAAVDAHVARFSATLQQLVQRGAVDGN